MASNDTIKFECPKCLGTVIADRNQAGERTECPDCQASLKVPDTTISNPVFDNLFDEPAPKTTSQPKAPKSEPAQSGVAQDAFSDLDVESLKKEHVPQISLPEEIDTTPEPDGTINLDSVAPIVVSSPQSEAAEIGEQLLHDVDHDLVPDIAPMAEVDPKAPLGERDPFEFDRDAKIKIDAGTPEVKSEEIFGVKCHICDTRLHATQKQIGEMVKCPECYTQVKIVAPKSNSPNTPESWNPPSNAAAQFGSAVDEIKLAPQDSGSAQPSSTSPVSPPQKPEVEIEIEPGFGLEPVVEDLLAPRPVDDESQESPHDAYDTDGADSTLDLGLDDDQPLMLRPIDDELARPTSPVFAPQPTKETAPQFAPEQNTQRPNRPKPQPKTRPRAQDSAKTDEPLPDFDFKLAKDVEAEEARASEASDTGLVPITFDDVYKFTLASFKSSELAIRAIFVLLPLSIAYWLIESGAATWFEPELGMSEYIFAGMFLAAGAVVWVISALVLSIIFVVVFRDAADGTPNTGSWPGIGMSEWLGSLSFLAFSLWVSAMPGFFVGNVMWWLPASSAIWILMLTPISVFAILPLLMICALHNDSIIKIFSPDVFKSLQDSRTSWIGMYKVIGISLLVFLVGTLIIYFVPVIGFNALGAVVQIVATVTLAIAIGLHAGRVIAHITETG